MPPLTEEQKAAREEKAARLLAKLETFFDDDGDYKKFGDRVQAIETAIDEFKGIDPSAVNEALEKLKAGQQRLTETIRNSKHGLYVSGIEDEDFGVLRAMIGVRTNNWKGAGKEKEIMDQAREKAAQISGDQVQGRYFIPDQVIADVIGPIYSKSVFINLGAEFGETRVSVLDGLMGGEVKVPKFDGGLIAYWIGEEDEYVESQVKVGDMTMKPNKLGILVRITDSMRRFQGYGFENLLRTDMIRAGAKKIDWTIAYGNGGDNMPLGLLYQKGIKVFLMQTAGASDPDYVGTNIMFDSLDQLESLGATATGADINFDSLEEMNLSMEEDDIVLDSSSAFVGPKRAFSVLKRQKVTYFTGQTSDQGYLIGAPFIPDSRLRDIIGDFGWSNQIDSRQNAGSGVVSKTNTTNDGKCTTLFGGNLQEVVFGRWSGIEIEDDDGKGKGFTSDHLYMKLRMYADVGVRQPRGVFFSPDVKVR